MQEVLLIWVSMFVVGNNLGHNLTHDLLYNSSDLHTGDHGFFQRVDSGRRTEIRLHSLVGGICHGAM